MSAIPFPASPTPSLVFTYLGRSWRWDDVRGVWEGATGSGASRSSPDIVVTKITPVSGDYYTGLLPVVDEILWINPLSDLESYGFFLPQGADAVIGQVKKFHSSANIAIMAVDGAIAGVSLSSVVQESTAAWQCVENTESATTWMRLY